MGFLRTLREPLVAFLLVAATVAGLAMSFTPSTASELTAVITADAESVATAVTQAMLNNAVPSDGVALTGTALSAATLALLISAIAFTLIQGRARSPSFATILPLLHPEVDTPTMRSFQLGGGQAKAVEKPAMNTERALPRRGSLMRRTSPPASDLAD